MNPEQLNLKRILVLILDFKPLYVYYFWYPYSITHDLNKFVEFSTWGLLISLPTAHGEGYRNYGGSGNYKSKYH